MNDIEYKVTKSEFDYEVIKIFGPSIFKVKIPQDIINKLNNYVDETIKNDKESKKLNYGEYLVGDVTQEFMLEKGIIQEIGWGNF